MSLFLLLSLCSSSQIIAHTLEVCLVHHSLNRGSERIGQPPPLRLSNGFTMRESKKIVHPARDRIPLTGEWLRHAG